jgi:hypothetical protein
MPLLANLSDNSNQSIVVSQVPTISMAQMKATRRPVNVVP